MLELHCCWKVNSCLGTTEKRQPSRTASHCDTAITYSILMLNPHNNKYSDFLQFDIMTTLTCFISFKIALISFKLFKYEENHHMLIVTE